MNSLAPLRKTYIDLFAGCGGLSLGLQQAGWEGVFAVERSEMAFKTLRHNLIDGPKDHFPSWPTWLPKGAMSIQKLTDEHAAELSGLRGQVTLVAGGPPCQGFSSAGKRQKNDHRNKLYQSYLKVVDLVRPSIVLLENVTGMKMTFGPRPKKGTLGRRHVPYSERLKNKLSDLGYLVFDSEVLASDFGVPQARRRFVAIGIDAEQFGLCPLASPFETLAALRESMLQSNGLAKDVPVSATQALGDIKYAKSRIVRSPDSKGFMAGTYGRARYPYQRLMRGAIMEGTVADSHRFVNHSSAITRRFKSILEKCRRGTNISKRFKKARGINKLCLVPLHPGKPAVTVTTIPDDMIHYAQPRVLTVRECARLQSFPDWFQFKSNYTTGGSMRKKQCPRYTQVGNAVPPLLAEALGKALEAWVTSVTPVANRVGQKAAA